MSRPWGDLEFVVRPNAALPSSDPNHNALTLQPGETGTLFSISNYAAGNLMRIVSMAVTQHPKTDYGYSIDGITQNFPAPLGSFINPLYTCRDLGFHIDVYSNFVVVITNHDDVAHTYVGQVAYIQEYIAS